MKYTKVQDTPAHKGWGQQNRIKFWSRRVATVMVPAFLAYAGNTVVDRVSATTQSMSCESDWCVGNSWFGGCIDAIISSNTGCNMKGIGC